MKIIKIGTLKDRKEAASQVVRVIGDHNVFAFYGNMGAGKTTFIKAICTELGVMENITSPTFALVNEYTTKDNRVLFHFDCYRLKNLTEAYDIGVDEYFYSGELCFIEWPEKIEEILPLEKVEVTIQVLDDESREITINI